MTLGEIVRGYREKNDISQRQFAIACGLSNGYISMLEKNENPKTRLPLVPSLLAFKKIADVMGTPLNDLLSRVDDMPVGMAEYMEEDMETPTAYIDSGHTREFCELFELLPEAQQALILREIRALLEDL